MAKFQSPGHYTDKDREKIKHFAGSNQTYPIVTPQDVEDAAGLIGNSKHDSKETLQANITKIAHQLGPEFVAKLPASWTGQKEKERVMEPETTRNLTDATRIILPSSIRISDAERREVEVCATSEAVDSYGTVFGYDASKDAFTRWFGNIREMHDKKAVGRKVDVQFDDEAHKVYVRGRISRGAEDTWQKLLDGTLTGASIGASNVQWERKQVGQKLVPTATRYDLIELSLVDLPSNPDGVGVSILRAAGLEETRGSTGSASSVSANAPATSPHDVLAAMGQGDADADAEPRDALFNAEPEHTVEEWDPQLRPVQLEGAGTVPAAGNSNQDVLQQFRPLGGPPPDADDGTFAAPRPATVLGSHGGNAADGMGGIESLLPGNNAGPAPRAAQAGSRSLAERVGDFAAESGVSAASTAGTPLAPFGYGATGSPQSFHLPPKSALRQARQAAEAERAAVVTMAGDLAEASIPPWDPTAVETWDVWNARRMRTRGMAEQQVLRQQQQEAVEQRLATEAASTQQTPTHTRAEVQALHQQQLATQRAAVVEQEQAAQVVRAERAQVAETARLVRAQGPTAPIPMASPVSLDALSEAVRLAVEQALAERAPANSALVTPNGPTPAAAPPVLNNQRMGHVHGHGHMGTDQHGMDGSHGHEHLHRDGTSHEHPHLHDHDHADHHGELRAAGASGHDHDHAHLHEHTHTYRSGQPHDTTLLLAQEQRARKTTVLETLAPTVPPMTLNPVSGSAQSAVNPAPKSPQLAVNSAVAGNLDILNTEDGNALSFGVPGEAKPKASPDGRGPDGLQITPPAGLHEGGHQGSMAPAGLNPPNAAFVHTEAPNPTDELPHGGLPENAGIQDSDGDHDGDEDARELAGALAATSSGTMPGLDKGARPNIDNAALVHPGGRAAEAEEARVGARISEDGRQAIHTARSTQIEALVKLCRHCSCDECTSYLDHIANLAHPLGAPERLQALLDDPEHATALFAQQRLLAAVVSRAVAAEVAHLTDAWTTRFADLEMTLADSQQHQRAALADVTRSLPTTTLSDAESVRFAETTTTRVAALVEPLSQRLEALAAAEADRKADVEEIRASLARLEAQPLDLSGPAMNRTAMPYPGSGGGALTASGNSIEQQIAALQEVGRQTRDPQVSTRLAVEVARLQRDSVNGAPTRNLLEQRPRGR